MNDGSAQRRPRHGMTAKGFTLVELLVVISIVSLLAGIAYYGLSRGSREGDRLAAETFIRNLSTTLDAYAEDPKNGDYPPTLLTEETYPKVGSYRNKTNCGIESVVFCLSRKGGGLKFDFENVDLMRLVNDDGDSTPTVMTDFDGKDLFEVIDSWGTPLVYFHSRDYGSAETNGLGSVTNDVGDVKKAKPWKQANNRGHYNRRSFQIISAGPDREFNTEDDITNFSRQ